MIIWSGFGILVPVVYFIVALLCEWTLESLTGNDKFYQQSVWGILLTGTVSGVALFFIAMLLGMREGREVIDKNTGEEFNLKSSDTFFFIPIYGWSVLVFLLGFVFAGLRLIYGPA